MNQDFDTFLVGLYVIVCDWLKTVGQPAIRPAGGSPPALTDGEMLTLLLAQQFVFATWSERRWLRWLRRNGYWAWFPKLQDQSAYTRRARNLSGVLAALRVTFAQDLLADGPPEAVVDGTPIHVRHWRRHGPHHVALPEADLGYCAAKREYFYGYRLVALVTLSGIVIDYTLLPASGDERDGLEELLADEEQWTIWADKGLLDADRQARLATEQNIRLVTPRRRNQKQQLPPAVQGELRRKRPIVETTFAQAKGIFDMEAPGAHTWSGLLVRLSAKLAAMMLMAWANVQHGRSPLSYVQFAW
jgi:Transposase DDE domain